MLERSHLQILLAISDCGSLTKAAQQLHLTQPALTHSIKKLEQRIGAPLWQKQGRQLKLTQAGEFLRSLGERLLPQFEHAEQVVAQIGAGRQGILRIGMECHPCYQWLLTIVEPYLQQWPDVDVDVRQRFQFGGLSALFDYDIDMLVTPDPLFKSGLIFTPVFDYEQVLVVSQHHPLANVAFVTPDQLSKETLISYPVAIERLDIYNQFLLPANCHPKHHKTIETTDIMLQMVAANRGVTALPLWLAEQYQQALEITTRRLGDGITKSIYLGIRASDEQTQYLQGFIQLALSNQKR